MNESKQAKKYIEHVAMEHHSNTIEVEWTGNRTPQEIEIMGEKKLVERMSDGVIVFADGSSATYERLVDDYPRRRQKIRLTYISK